MIRIICVTLAMGLGMGLAGCVRAAKDPTGFAVERQGVVSAGYEDTWHAVKRTLRDQGYEIYTRDKRGIFVAFTDMRRALGQPKRIKYTVELGAVNDSQTDIYIEAVRQSYGVTLLTDPDWHDRRMEDDGSLDAILAAVEARATGEMPAAVESQAASSAPDTVEAATL